MKKTINYTISQRAARLKWEPFEVTPGMTMLRFIIRVPEECRCMGFIIIEDARGEVRLQKFLGHGGQKLALGLHPRDTSIGGVPGRLVPGEWRAGLGVFTEYALQRLGGREESVQVILTDEPGEVTEPLGDWAWTKEGSLCLSGEKYGWNQVYCPQAGWYKGDFHTHTTLSDGKETRKKAMEKAGRMGLDFYVPTEHNLLHTGWCGKELCILPGMEVTTDKGHFNLFGLTKAPQRLRDIVADSKDEQLDRHISEIMGEARKEGWLISLNHPFLTIWSWRCQDTSLSDFDCVEIVNDPTYMDAPLSNDRAIRFVDALWQDGHRIYGIGGSDSHNTEEEYYEGAVTPSIPGDPGTYVYCDCLTPAELMGHVKSGHMCVSRFCSIEPLITINGRVCLPGDRLPAPDGGKEGELYYGMKIKGLKEAPVVLLVINGNTLPLETFWQEDKSFGAGATVSVSFEDWTWVRAEVRKETGEFLGYVNSVYCGSKIPDFKTVGEITKWMEESGHDSGHFI